MPPRLLLEANLSQRKERMTLKLLEVSFIRTDDEPFRQNPVFPSITDDTVLHDLLGSRSILTFQRLKFKMDGMQSSHLSHTRWSEFSTYQRFQEVVWTLKVVNDVGERGVHLMEDYNDIPTQSEQRNLTMQDIGNRHRLSSGVEKFTLTRSTVR